MTEDAASAPDAASADASDASIDALEDQIQPQLDAADDVATDAGPEANICPAPYCAGSWIYEYHDVQGYGCVGFATVSCAYGCTLGDAGPTCIAPPPECALAYVPEAGASCPVAAGGGLCFPDAASACACKCPGKSCEVGPPKPSLEIPKLKLPKKGDYPPADAGTSEAGAPDATAPSASSSAAEATDASSGGDAGATDASPDAGTLVVSKCY